MFIRIRTTLIVGCIFVLIPLQISIYDILGMVYRTYPTGNILLGEYHVKNILRGISCKIPLRVI